ncbi:hypothetical protein NPIL_388651 [Nephila pilipes]|uniref:Uncharacterized protein n=1 Tax=Nephila pilipes TaxID=299642 RepID=A0A8X6U9F0_NEPPI|nr:hypothetical protein NPIL_388651 [Nephila pilipes]
MSFVTQRNNQYRLKVYISTGKCQATHGIHFVACLQASLMLSWPAQLLDFPRCPKRARLGSDEQTYPIILGCRLSNLQNWNVYDKQSHRMTFANFLSQCLAR